ncbi:MAG: YgiQ family radical SAM protein [Candidatus Zixiibacteriota bacterium]|nr:MAG: YgiQ family radical SAM protein [candidate division Zixibacteria bacterium]
MFLPTTQEELHRLGWKALDVILVTGDSYIDSPYIGVAVIGKVLVDAGFRVGIIGQPDINTDHDITRLGNPKLFWGVTGGCIDSMVANYTALKKKRRSDDYTAGGKNIRRPDRAIIVYSNLIRRYFKDTSPIVLGGVEASMRRISHYDYWSDSIRRSILFDAKADYLIYGMGERSTIELASKLRDGQSVENIKGMCYITKEPKRDYIMLPSHDKVARDNRALIDMFHTFYRNNDPVTAKGLCQQQDTRYLIQNPPAPYLNEQELDHVHGLDYERNLHSYHSKDGQVKALETIRFAVTTHRGCYGECNFCSIGVHQGRTVRCRSEQSIIEEVKLLTRHTEFKGNIHDVGGPTANMYGFECPRKATKGNCNDKRCVYPKVCRTLKPNHSRQTDLLKRIMDIPRVKRVFVASGIRYDLVLADKQHGSEYLRQLVQHHVSGQLKLAPEHSEDSVLALMGKPKQKDLIDFRRNFLHYTKRTGKKQFLTYYLIAAHPGCTEQHMRDLKKFTGRELKMNPEQVQVFTPLPSTYSALMYHTEVNPFTGDPVFVEKSLAGKQRQKKIIIEKRRK